MIKEERLESVSDSKLLQLPSKAVIIEQCVLTIAAYLLAGVDLMGVLDTFGLAWLTVLFITDKPAVASLLGVLCGRVVMHFGDPSTMFTDACIHIGGFALFSIAKKIQKNPTGTLYVVLDIVFYVCTQTALVLVYEHTAYNALYIILNVLIMIAVIYFYLRVAKILFNSDGIMLTQTDAIGIAVFASLLIAGLGNATLWGISIRSVLSLAVLLTTASISGAAMGTLVGTVFSVVLGLSSQVDFYTVSAFVVCSAVCGTLKNMNKIAVGVIIFGMYIGLFVLLGSQPNTLFTVELLIALIIFCIIPTKRLTKVITVVEDAVKQTSYPVQSREYAERIRLVCSDSLGQVMESSQRMNKILDGYLLEAQAENKEQFDALVEKITGTVCCHCTMGETCAFANNNMGKKSPTCEVAKLVSGLNHVGNEWRAKMALCRSIPGIAVGCMSRSMERIQHELNDSVNVDEFLSARLQSECISVCKQVRGVAAINSQNGVEILIDLRTKGLKAVQVDELMQRCSDLLDVELERRDIDGAGLCFTQKSSYKLTTGTASVSLDADGLCGDSGTIIPFGKDGFMLAVVDGCGTGYSALAESNKVMEVLEALSQSGCDENSTVSLVNSLMGIRAHDDKYSSADLCIFNKYNGDTKFIKMGAVSSFIIQKDGVAKVECGAGPLGTMPTSSGLVSNFKLKAKDVIVMMTDGVFDACSRYHDPDEYFINLLSEYQATSAQETAEYIMKNALSCIKRPKDDMLVFVAMVSKRQ